jgi:hypothetical protein
MITNNEHVRIWNKLVLAQLQVLQLAVHIEENDVIKEPECRSCLHELVPC